MDSLKIEVKATVKINNRNTIVYCEAELDMNQEQFDKLSVEEIQILIKKYVDWKELCGTCEENVISISIENSYAVNPITGMAL